MMQFYALLTLVALFCATVGHSLYHNQFDARALLIFVLVALVSLQVGYAASMLRLALIKS